VVRVALARYARIVDAAAYLRVSSRAQDDATQRSSIARAAAARGDTITAWYAEKKSGKTLARPELDRVRVDARAGTIRRLYLFKLDRLTRSGIRDTFDVVEEFRSHGVELLSVADGFDLSGPAAEVVLAVMAWAAKMERLAINERISAARERVEANGGRWGRPRRLDPRAVDRVQQMQRGGLTLREIAVALKVPLSTVGRAAKGTSQKDASGSAATLRSARRSSVGPSR
jgi:DNA invertase Pin-like site-specific DNA recombinase